jgi:hypothetical protein
VESRSLGGAKIDTNDINGLPGCRNQVQSVRFPPFLQFRLRAGLVTNTLEDGRRGEARLPVECEGPAELTDEVLMAACAIYAFLRSGEEEPGADAGRRPN